MWFVFTNLIIGLIMGVNYSVVPVTVNEPKKIEIRSLDSYSEITRSNCITPNKILDILKGMKNYNLINGVESGIWQAVIEHEDDEMLYTSIVGFNYKTDDDPLILGFEKGDPKLIIEISHLLSIECGSFLLQPDSGESPLLIHKDMDVYGAIKTWGHTKTD